MHLRKGNHVHLEPIVPYVTFAATINPYPISWNKYQANQISRWLAQEVAKEYVSFMLQISMDIGDIDDLECHFVYSILEGRRPEEIFFEIESGS